MASGPESLNSNIQDISNNFMNFFEEKTHTDVDFHVKCGDDWITISAHKLVLSIWSPVFADMFFKRNPLIDNYDESLEIIDLETTSMDIVDASPQSFEAMVKFMYGNVHDLHTLRRDIPFILKTYKLATLYDVEGLKLLLINAFVHIKPNKENVFQLMDTSKKLDCQRVGANCVKFLETNSAQVLNAQDLCEVTADMIKIILKLERVSFSSEYELISWVMAWAKNQHVKIDNDLSFRGILEPFLPLLNFLALKVEKFGELLEERPDVFTDFEISSIFRSIIKPGVCALPSWLSTQIKRTYNYRG